MLMCCLNKQQQVAPPMGGRRTGPTRAASAEADAGHSASGSPADTSSSPSVRFPNASFRGRRSAGSSSSPLSEGDLTRLAFAFAVAPPFALLPNIVGEAVAAVVDLPFALALRRAAGNNIFGVQ